MATATPQLENQNKKVGLIAFAGALAMLGMGYAAVPLYDLFCRVTGFGGTTQQATEAEANAAEQLASASAAGRTMSIRFDASLARGVPWEFRPSQPTDTIQIGVRDMTTYVAKNNSSVPITGTATFNVEPEQAGIHFNKIQCFCFTQQTLQPGEEVHMPVLYFIDPAALEDEAMDGVEQITLSYTFHRARDVETEAGS
ncbi:cytochrome c oxidase assembly protein [Altererythrobacter lutimaris]|uniref:Cytochrome c oxidase assembly protein CtaG n=1 Tax=Altererythrobacter lutimaris TaxID=2743979 RepID=A0A850HHH3_9SPHN|nr:cytochrome c oxidase assembly protein [Altererythrobacter lutimaris]NVE94522.1 cytochrome c oxidase assembly protein [Altererythrobacter lutimaris]